MHYTPILAALLLTPGALAHGYLKTIISGGVSYPAWEPFTDPYITPKPVRYTRTFKDNGPVPVRVPSSVSCIQTVLIACMAVGLYDRRHHLQHRRQRSAPQ